MDLIVTMIVLALFGSDICSVMIQLFATPQRPQPTSQVSVYGTRTARSSRPEPTVAAPLTTGKNVSVQP